MKKPPKAIWLQLYGDPADNPEREIVEEVTWCADKINASDVRYVIDKRQVRRKAAKRLKLHGRKA